MITVYQFIDTHFHGRDGEMLAKVIKHLGKQCVAVLFMPNLDDPVDTAAKTIAYRSRIKQAGFQGEPILTIKLTRQTKPSTIRTAWLAGVKAAKLYPEGVTTGSEDGFRPEDLAGLDPLYAEMERQGMHMLFHGEMPGVYVIEREIAFLAEIERVARKFPKLKITLEHITTRQAVAKIRELHLAQGNVSATITIHHLFLTLDDVIGGKLRPHNFCQPVAKSPADRAALVEAALSGYPAFRFGSDSAPHPRTKKECDYGCAGVYTGPIMVPLLYEFFHRHGALDKLYDFTVTWAKVWFQLQIEPKPLQLVEETWIVPVEYDGIVPFWAGKELRFRLLPT